MSVFEQLKSMDTVREKEVEIGELKVLFREPPMGEHNTSRKRHMKYKMVQIGKTQELQFDSATSNAPTYNKELVMMTAYDPETRERIFENQKSFDAIFGEVNGKIKHGEYLFGEFLKHAQGIIKEDEEEGGVEAKVKN